MKPLSTAVPILAGLPVILTFLLLQGATPDVGRHERTLDALRTVILRHAALQRDVLRARAGILRNYDPLVRSIRDLGVAAAELGAVRDVASGETETALERNVAEVRAAIRAQEVLVEAFKSNNALLRNSLSYFNHLSGRLAAKGDSLRAIAPAEVGALTTAMLRFVGHPGPGEASDARAAVEHLARQTTLLTKDMHSLVAHGRLIVATLPTVDALVARVQTAPTTARARTLQDLYLDAHGRATARADIFRALLYVAALVLGGYVVYLFVRLRANARVLRERLAFEETIASISAQFINLPREHVGAGVGLGLSRLAEHAGLDRAEILVCRAGEIDPSASHLWPPPGIAGSASPLEETLRLALDWSIEEARQRDCIYVPAVDALPESPEKRALRARGARSWLCISMWGAGERIGFLSLEAAAAERRWRDDDIALLSTAAGIFANAIAREGHEAEREALQARLNQAQRLEAIGTFAGGIAHEFNNVLGAILGYSEMALMALRRNAPARRRIEQVVKAGERAQEIVEQVLAFGRRRESRHRPMQVEPAIAEAVDLLRTSCPATLTVDVRLEARGAAISGDATQIQQVLINLGTNAAQATDGAGKVELGLDAIETGEALPLSHGTLPAGRYVRLSVRDNGHGMDAATLERIFEPFFTTKPVGQGTGLGLATVHGIVAEHGGVLHVSSEPQAGTIFEVYLPRTEDDVAAPEAAPALPARRGRGETVLVVDDDRPLMLLGEDMLAALGYEPVGFDGAAAALAAVRADPTRFDLVLTDEVMPGMTGTELADALSELRPDLPVILMTGHGRPLERDRLRAAGIREVLRKPLRSKTLADCVARHIPVGDRLRA